MSFITDIKSIWWILRNQWSSLKAEFKGWKRVRSLRSKFLKYVPKYITRSQGDHVEIRKMIQPRPPCLHLKGGANRRYAAFADYNVSQHTFIDGTTRIICNSCRKKWFPESPDWEKAKEMVSFSSNSPSSSEIPIEYRYEDFGTPTPLPRQ